MRTLETEMNVEQREAPKRFEELAEGTSLASMLYEHIPEKWKPAAKEEVVSLVEAPFKEVLNRAGKLYEKDDRITGLVDRLEIAMPGIKDPFRRNEVQELGSLEEMKNECLDLAIQNGNDFEAEFRARVAEREMRLKIARLAHYKPGVVTEEPYVSERDKLIKSSSFKAATEFVKEAVVELSKRK